MATYDLGKVVGDAGEKGDDGSTVWNTSTAPTYANNKYTFNISNLSGKTGLQIAVNDIIFYSTYYYIVSAVNTTTVDCTTRISIKGSDASVTIVDNLTSTSSTSALSAKQGKVLNDNKIETSSIATSFGSTTSDSKVPSEKLTKNSLDAKQETLVSGTNIKTINNNSLLGSGNINIESGSDVDIVTSWEATLSDSKVPSEKLTKNTLDGKAPTSHASSANTYGLGTTANYGHVKTINGLTQSSHSDGTALSAYQGKLLKDAIDAKPDSSDIPTKTSDLTNDGADGTNVFVANNDSRLSDSRTPTSHTHGNLTNDGKVGSTANYFVYTTTSGAITSKQKIGNITTSGAIGSTSGLPVITTTSGVLTTGAFGTSSGQFAEGNHTHSGYISTSSTAGLIKNDGTIDTSAYITSSSLPTIQTSWGSTTSDSKVASEKLIKDSLDGKQASLVSGTNIKTINNESLLGSGNITIQGGGGSGGSYINDFYGDSSTNELVIDYDTGVSQADIVTSWSSTTSDTNVPSEKLTKNSLDDKVSKSSTAGLLKNDGTVMTSGTGSSNWAVGNHTHSGYVSATKVTSWSSTVSDSNVPSEKLVKDYIDNQIGTAIQYIQQ